MLQIQCNKPTYIGDGRVCGLDSDSDGFPDEGLDCSQYFCSKVLQMFFYYTMYVRMSILKFQDLCPDIYSVLENDMQSITFCTEQTITGKDGFVY